MQSSLTLTHIRIDGGHMTTVPLIVPPLFDRHLLGSSDPLGHVSFETAGLTSACGRWVISDSQQQYSRDDLPFEGWHSPTGCASRLWKKIELFLVRLRDVSVDNVQGLGLNKLEFWLKQ